MNKYNVYCDNYEDFVVYATEVKIDRGVLIFTGSMGTIVRAVASGQWNNVVLMEGI